jgi:hypothetical protein
MPRLLYITERASDRIPTTTKRVGRDRKMSNWTVWVGGVELNARYLTQGKADSIAHDWRSIGYDDVKVEEIK